MNDRATCERMRRHPLAVLALLALPLAFPVSAGAQVPQAVTFEEAVTRTLVAHPSLAAARRQRAVDVAGVAVAAERPNPDTTVELARETPKRAFGVSFPWELGGKRARRLAVAEAAVRTGEAAVEVEGARLRSEVRRAYFDLALAAARLTTLQDLVTLAGRARDTARVRFDAGDVPRLEVVEAELAVASAETDVVLAAGQVRAARIALNALLQWPLDAAPVLVTPIESLAEAGTTGLIERATARHPELAMLDRSIEEQRAKVALATSMRRPDLVPGATLTQGAQPEFSVGWRASLSVTLPLFTTHEAGVAVEQAMLDKLLAERLALSVTMTGMVASSVAAVDAQRGAYLRYRDGVVPRATELETLAQDSYRLGQTGMPALLRALEATRDVRLRTLDTLVQLHVALTELERAAGVPLP